MSFTSSTALQDDAVKVRVRERQWIYLGPIAAAPITHICVTLYSHAKTKRHQRLLFGTGIVGATFVTVGMRLYLMQHAGYPGSEDNRAIYQREKLVTMEQKAAIENPTLGTITKEALRGFA